MNLNGRRESSNVEDRRGGIVGVIIAMAIAYFSGGDPLSAGMQALQENGGLGSLTGTNTEVSAEQREFTEEEQELAHFSTQILAGTEDVWKEIFKEHNSVYQVPTMVLYTDGTQTACGQGSAQMGPFYCSGDQKLYIDLSFFTTMKQQLGADGDFAYAYVIAHEVGHHVEYLTGILEETHAKMARMSQTEANKLSVRLELLADFYVFGHTTTTRCSAPWRMATLRRPSTAHRSLATTICRRKPVAMPFPSPSITAPHASASSGSSVAWRLATSLRATPSNALTQSCKNHKRAQEGQPLLCPYCI